MNEIISRLEKMDIKNIETLILTASFMFLSISGGVTWKWFLTIFTIAIGFY